MNNILDLLYDYSKRGKKVDRKFISKVIKVMIEDKELKDYIKKTRFDQMAKYKTNHSTDDCVPMAYKWHTREIILDETGIEFLRNLVEKTVKSQNFSKLEQVISCNALILQAILHEIEHANQQKKSRINNGNFENLLLAICSHTQNEFFKESKLSQLLIDYKGMYLNPQLYYDMKLNSQIENQYSSSSPIERMANIYSLKDVKNMLGQIQEEIPNAIGLFQNFLISFYLQGYDFQKNIISPTERYLEDYRKLRISGTEAYFNEKFELIINEVKKGSLEDRLTLGLPISKEEYQQTKILLPKNMR